MSWTTTVREKRRVAIGRRPTKAAAIALANKIARMAWAMMVKVSVTNNRSTCAVTRSRRITGDVKVGRTNST